MPPRVLALSRNGTATLMRIGHALGLVGFVGFAMLVVVVLSDFTGTTGSDILVVFLMLSPLLAIAGHLVVQTLRPMGLVVHADALEVRHPRMLRRPLVIPRSNVRTLHLDDGAAAGAARFPTGRDDEPFLWANRWVTVRQSGRPIIGDGVLPNVAVELVDPITIEQARHPWVAACQRGEPDPPPRDEPVSVVMLAVEDPQAAEQALAGWGVRRPAAAPVLAPEMRPGPSQQFDMTLVVAVTMGAVPFYVMGLWELIPVHMILIGLALFRMVMRFRSELATAREAAAAQPPERRAAAAAAAEANWGPPPVG